MLFVRWKTVEAPTSSKASVVYQNVHGMTFLGDLRKDFLRSLGVTEIGNDNLGINLELLRQF